MREIKFRAWDKYAQELVNVKTFDLEVDGSVGCIVDYSGINLDASECVLMQYANLNDSEDTEIYKGDIVWDDVRERYGIVDFIDGKFGYVSENDYEDLCEVCNDIVIRGNIHENKELLEDK